MTGDARATTFMTGAAGFIGLELVKVLIGRGIYLAPVLDRLDGYLVAGLRVVTALPGWVYAVLA